MLQQKGDGSIQDRGDRDTDRETKRIDRVCVKEREEDLKEKRNKNTNY
jgi:hypothetical protein